MRRDGKLAMAGDGQVTLDKTIIKHRAKKVRRMQGGKVIGGFAGSAADGLTLYEKLEGKLEEYQGNLLRAAVEMAKDWRTDKYLRRLEAMLVVGNSEHLLVLSGTGDVIEPDDGIAAIGSGSPYVLAAARALARHTDKPAEDIVREALQIASEICIYTNAEVVLEVI
jgi:ATP-dependent HslUV protease subunit HslV